MLKNYWDALFTTLELNEPAFCCRCCCLVSKGKRHDLDHFRISRF